MRNIIFDICSIPIYIVILWTCYIRKISKDHASRVFITMNVTSLACTILDIAMEFAVNPVPLSGTSVVLGNLISYSYLFLRNATLVIYLIYVFAATRTEYRIRPRRIRFLVWLPNSILLLILCQNFITHNVFTVTAAEGYSRGPAMILLYIIAALYGLFGCGYCICAKRYLTTGKWIALFSVYVLTFIAVFIQLIIPEYLVEMFSTAIGLLMIMLLVMRPEETLDASVNITSWKAYQYDLKNILLSGQHVQIMVIQMLNAAELRTYIGEDEFALYIRQIADEGEKLFSTFHTAHTLYYERPGTFYLIVEDPKADTEGLVPQFIETVSKRMSHFTEQGVRFDPRFCIIRIPDDISDLTDILNLGHRFTRILSNNQTVFLSSEMANSRDYNIINHMEEILNRAITEGTLEMYYQPIYNIHEKKFQSAEALARINDPVYGLISPALFIPAAESAGLMLSIGDIILNSVYRFISSHNIEALGLNYIEINLSVAQCLQQDLPDTVTRLQTKYGVLPRQINFEVTETMFDNLSGIMDINLNTLARMGYTFSLDDYGVGFSNIQRLRTLPLQMIKIDKSLVDDMFTKDGEVIIEYTVRMMQGIHKKLVFEGVETKEATDACRNLAGDYIQGFYYSKPLPEDAFVRFLQTHNAA